MISMDDIDKRIILELDSDCRMSYQTMANKLGLSSTAIRKRITKLLESGIIDRFMTTLSLEMIDSDLIIAIVQTDGSEFQDEFIEEMRKNSAVVQVSHVACGQGGLYSVFAATSGVQALSDFGLFLRTLKTVTNVEIHVLVYPRGKKVELTRLQLRVLKHLVDDPRMSIADLAELTGMAARRVRRVIVELQERSGIDFSVYWNLGKGGLTEVLLRVEWDENITNHESMIDWLRKEFPLEFWTPFVSATAPIIFARFIVDTLEIIESIAKVVRKAPSVKSVTILVFFSNNMFEWPGVKELRLRLEEIK